MIHAEEERSSPIASGRASIRSRTKTPTRQKSKDDILMDEDECNHIEDEELDDRLSVIPETKAVYNGRK